MSAGLLAAGLIAGLLAVGPLSAGSAQAATPRGPGLTCAGLADPYDRLACRQARAARRLRSERSVAVVPALPILDPAPYGPGRYVSLLILGVGF